MPAPLSAVVAAAADGKSPSSSSSSSVNWWVVVIIVLLLLAVLVAVLLIVVWYKRVRRSGSIGVPTPVHGSQPYVSQVSQVTHGIPCRVMYGITSLLRPFAKLFGPFLLLNKATVWFLVTSTDLNLLMLTF